MNDFIGNIADHPTPKIDTTGVAYTLESRDYKNPQCVAIESHPQDSRVKFNAQDGRGGVYSQKMSDPEGNFVLEPKIIGNGQTAQMGMHDKAYALDCMHDQQAVMENLVVRRLTPKECSRLQGYPDGWMDIGEWTDSKGKLHKDSDAPKYKAAGNSIALPFWQWLMDRIAKQLKKDGCDNPTMASLFDGISGFPLCAIRGGIKPVWSSEIEEFPMAVAERHFGENGDLEKFL